MVSRSIKKIKFVCYNTLVIEITFHEEVFLEIRPISVCKLIPIHSHFSPTECWVIGSKRMKLTVSLTFLLSSYTTRTYTSHDLILVSGESKPTQ